tara:strand:- start:260 stop:712 length:453 start_codon:yes stop_codon:yes gene_type:complete
MHSGQKKAIQDLKKVFYWLENKGYETIFHNDTDSVIFSDKKIFLDKRSSTENQLYSILHECGHILQHQNKSTFNKSFKYQHVAENDKRKERSYAYRISVLEEEIDAWKRGKKLAKRLDIELDEIKFEKYKAKYTMTYVDWAASKEWQWQC